MGVFSEDGNWEFVDGDWIPTGKQKQLAITLPKPPINSNPIKFVNQQVAFTGNEVQMNVSADEQYASLSSITTTRTHTEGIVQHFGNPFFQDYQSRLNFQSIEDPGAEKLRQNLVFMHHNVQNTARKNFQSGEKTYSAKDIIRKLLNEGENTVGSQILRIKEVKLRLPNANLDYNTSNIPHSEHIGVRAIITNKRLMLVDSTEDTISNLENLSGFNKTEFMQRKKSGAFAVKHRIMHDFWIKSILHEDINASEFHFSDFSESKQELRRFHHPASIFLGIMSIFAFFFAFVDGNLGGFFLTALFGSFFLLISSIVVWWYFSQTKYYIMMSPHGKKRQLTIGYFDKIYNQNLILDITLEDGQNISDTTDWLRVLHDFTD
jgi:hypothetical protein